MSTKRNIIIIGPAYPLRGGIANFNEALAQNLLLEGHQVQIFSFSLQYPSFLFPGTTQFDKNGKAPAGLKITTRINSINPFNWFKTATEIANLKPDLIIVRYWLPFMAPCLATICKQIKKKINTQIIAITDNVIPHEKRIGDKTLTKYFVKQCDGFIAMSKSVLNDLEQFTNNTHKTYLPHPIYNIFGEIIPKDISLKKLNLNSNDKHLLFFGFIRKYKGLDLLLEAMADQRIKSLGLKLIVAGEFYEDESYYKNMISKHQLADQVILKTSFIPSEDVKYYFCAADLITQPYKTATQSGVTQIAYHFERPMLVTNVGGLAEIVANNKAGYVTNLNPTSIADAIVNFYEHKRENEFVNFIREEKKRFEWSYFIQGIESLSQQITKTNS